MQAVGVILPRSKDRGARSRDSRMPDEPYLPGQPSPRPRQIPSLDSRLRRWRRSAIGTGSRPHRIPIYNADPAEALRRTSRRPLHTALNCGSMWSVPCPPGIGTMRTVVAKCSHR
jgi:hypothetical protein